MKAKIQLLRPFSPSREQGSTLIEVLVAIFVLSLGLLGIAGLQSMAMKLNQTALSRSIATVYAENAMDILRSNPVALCTNSAAFNSWTAMTTLQASVTSNLPNGSLVVTPSGSCAAVNTGLVYQVTVKWEQAGTGSEKLAATTTEQEIIVQGRVL
jgi:type IV pilus assembly protein PilV